MNPSQATQPHIQAQAQSDPQSEPFSWQATLARFGIARLLVKLPVIASSMSVGQEAYFPLYVRPQSLQTADNEMQGIPASLAQAAAVKTFGDLPLIVLTGKLNDRPGWQEWQAELLQLSSNSQQSFAQNSGHIIQLDEPEAAVAAILKMVELIR
jgi:pimeloyl-ACP methyl ester carboxylesterase